MGLAIAVKKTDGLIGSLHVKVNEVDMNLTFTYVNLHLLEELATPKYTKLSIWII